MYLTRLFCAFVCLFVVFFLSFYKSPPPLILFNKLNLFSRHHLLLFNIFITVILITCPFTTALSIAALVVSALFICASSLLLRSLAIAFFTTAIRFWRSSLLTLLGSFLFLRMALTHLTWQHLKSCTLFTAFVWRRNAGKNLADINWHPFIFLVLVFVLPSFPRLLFVFRFPLVVKL